MKRGTGSTKSHTSDETDVGEGARPGRPGSTRTRRQRSRAGTATRVTLPELPARWWWLGVAVVVLVAAFLRLWALDLRPEHHDEGVNGQFMTQLIRQGVYHYDPANFHGPTLYFLAVPLVRLMGLTIQSLRLETALFGIGVVALVLCLYRRIGRRGALVAAALLAVSPGAVFISRYFIHEMLLLFFTLGVVVAVANSDVLGRTLTVALVAGSAAMMFATKETGNMTLAVLLIADYLAILFLARYGLLDEIEPRTGGSDPDESSGQDAAASRGTGGARLDDGADVAEVEDPEGEGSPRVRSWLVPVLVGSTTFVALYLLFFSSFGTHWPGVGDSLVALNVWAKTGTKTLEHRAPLTQHLAWMRQIEAPILLLGLLGVGVMLWRRPSRFCVFSALWALGMVALYSLIPYKTPWLLLNAALPLAITAGAGVEVMARRSGGPTWVWVGALAVAFSVPPCLSLNFVRYDDNTQPYVYAHTVRGARGLMAVVDQQAAATGAGKDLRVSIFSPEHWPMPWWFRDYGKAIFWGKVTLEGDPQVIIARADQESEVTLLVGNRFQKQGRYVLRPGLELTVFTLTPAR